MIKWFLIIFAVWWIWDTWGWAVFGYALLALVGLVLLAMFFSGDAAKQEAEDSNPAAPPVPPAVPPVEQPPAQEGGQLVQLRERAPQYSDAVAPVAPDKFHMLSAGSVARDESTSTSTSTGTGTGAGAGASSRKSTANKKTHSNALLPAVFRFTYTDADFQSSERTVKVNAISTNGGFTYLEGYCEDRKGLRTFRTDRIDGSLVDIESGEILSVKQLLSSVHPRKAMTYKPAPAVTTKKEGQTAVLFTGFTAKRREELEELASAAGWDVRSTVGKTLDYLVTGPRAGPSKIAKAEELGVTVVDEDIFRGLV